MFSNKKGGEAANLTLKMFLASASFIFLICSYFTTLAISSDMADILSGSNDSGFILPNVILLITALLSFYSILVLSLRHLKNKSDWLYTYCPVIIIFLSVLLIK